MPCGTTRFSRFFLNSFLRLVGFAPGAAAPVAAPSCVFGSFATAHLGMRRQRRKIPYAGGALLPNRDLLLRGHRALARTFTRTRVGVRPLPVDRQIAAMANPAVRLNFDQPPDIHLNLFAEIAFHAAFGFDGLAQMIRFVLG